MTPYRHNLEHLEDEFRRLDAILRRAVAEFRQTRAHDKREEFRGLYITDEEIDEATAADQLPRKTTNTEAAASAVKIEGRVAATIGCDLRLRRLATIFNLDSFAYNLVILLLASEVSQRYQKLFAYLQDDVSRKRPTVDLAIRLFFAGFEQQPLARKAFHETSPLVVQAIIAILEDQSERSTPLLNRSLKLHDRIVEFLLGNDFVDNHLVNPLRLVRWKTPRLSFDDLLLSPATRASLVAVSEQTRNGEAPLCVIHGQAGCGRKAAAEAICKSIETPLLIVDAACLPFAEASVAMLLKTILREAMLYNAAVYFDGWHPFVASCAASPGIIKNVQSQLNHFAGLVFLGADAPWQPDRLDHPRFANIALPTPSKEQRRCLWTTHLNHGLALAPDVKFEILADTFRFTPGQIGSVAGKVRRRANTRPDSALEITMEELLAGCRAESIQQLGSFARQIRPQRSWRDLILPPNTLAQIEELCQHARHSSVVYDQWGFGGKLTLGKGLIALFSGPSGTGKTLCAEILAHELARDLYRIDLSCVVSKYIGETEKNLSRVFAEAEESNAILFFDEADALFGKRSEVKDAHDRYANIEINYLLQRVEEFDGIVILASNLSKNIDAAFLRRLHFAVEFPFPTEDNRLLIWRNIFPAIAPIGPDMDFNFLARNFKVTGGNIKNVAVAAAFRAAHKGRPIAMEDIILSMRREYQKLGRICERLEFEPFYHLLQ